MNEIERIVSALADAGNVLVCTHVPPDGDGYGSGLAVVRMLRAKGAAAMLATGGPVQSCLTFLAEEGETDESPEGPDSDYDLAVVLDAGDRGRTGALGPRVDACPVVVNIDHHGTNTRFGDLNWVDPDSPAVGEMIFRLLEPAGHPLTEAIALPLYVAIVTDTGRFAYSSTRADTFRMAAALVDAGVRPHEVFDRIYRTRREGFLRLSGRVLTEMATILDGRAAHVTLTPEMMRESGADPLDAGDVIDLPISMAGVEVALLFRAAPGGTGTKVGFRSRSWFPVDKLAGAFGGGGHPRAAGTTVNGPVDEVRALVLAALEKAFSEEEVRR